MIPNSKPLLVLLFLLYVVKCNSQTVASTSERLNVVDDTTFVSLKEYSSDFVYDMKYATEDNFLKAKVYDCAECYLRYKTVKALILANERLLKKGFKIKLFDCYRPLDIQKKMWAIVPNPKYVANPSKGSIHNRGGAVDITLVDLNGKELDMGTAFDYFGIEASHNYPNFSKEIKNNRKFLRKYMEKENFNSFDSEWWHYNLRAALNDKVSNVKWDCN
ncbi:M15 family metallopeptidase [Flavobacterium sp. ZT3R18]|uniref:M15 family metallopeptidase n=1 Tax=Flavobacterium sp. ZT3R18 TaxID=2594429 RepID=UPI00117A05A8|nr:M15 family metallopeptidase [Flavobacterium sp. ZT3R18]TRX35132.1 M15 family metallopeptidase [Flavobacterium sp. ZT3R18]